jgi:cobalt-zinc-cadmium resistance protein CzcA
MLNKIIEFSIKNKLIMLLLVLFWVAWGVYQTTKLPIDAVPDITNNQVQVITVTPALGAPDVERLITFPIEQACSNIPGVIEMRSFSRFGLSLVTIVFNDATNVYWARQQISERLQQVQSIIPPGVGVPSLAPVTTGLGEIYQYVVRAKKGYEGKYDARELRTIQDWIVRRQLLGTPGVADVSSFGGLLKQYEIAVKPNELKAYNITIADVFAAIEKSNENTGGAYIEKGPTVLYIRSEGLVKNIADIENIVIKKTVNGIPVLVRNVAEVKIGDAIRYGAMCYNDKGEVAGAIVMMLKGENSSAVIKRVKQRIAQIQKTLPEGVVIEPFLDRTKMVNNAIGTVERNLMEGALIVVFVLVLFLGNLRAGLVVASVIPLSMLFAISMMNLFGVSGNLMSLGALDFGLIVDGAVIIVETVMHRLTHSKHFSHINRLSQGEMDKEVKESASKMMNSAVFGQIIILIVYLPILSLEGIEGKMFKPMAQTVSFAILGAFILSLTYVPMMSAFFLSKKITHQPTFTDKMMNLLERWYQHWLERILRFPKTVIAAAVSMFILAVFILMTLGGEFIPKLEEGDFAVDTRVLTGSNLNTTIKSTQEAAHVLLSKFPEVEKVVTKIGSGEIPTDPMPIEASDMMVILKDKKEWTSAKSFDELAEKMGTELSTIPGITTGFQFPVQMRFNELMTGARQDVVCKIFGDDLDSLALYAARLGEIIHTVNGAKDLYVETVNGMPQIMINFNRPAIAQFGLTVNEINHVINTAFAGRSTGIVFEGEKRFDLVVRLAGDARKNIEDVRNLLIPVPNGTQIPLYQVASIEEKEGPNQIQREEARRRIVVGFNVRGRDVQSVVNEVQQKVDNQIRFPAGYYVTYGGAFKNLEEAKVRLSIAVPVALLLILLMLYFAFKSVKYGLLIYSAIPLSAIGGVFSLWSRGMPFSISAGVGFIALFGVAVLNGIVLIAEFIRLKQEGWTDTRRIVLQGTKIRLRPVLMTAAVASLGFLPMALSQGAGAEVQRPLATVVIGGLITSTLLTLFVLPVLYILFEKGYKKSKMKNVTVLLFLFAAGSTAANAQSFTLQQAIDTALAQNLQLKAAQLNTVYYRQLSRASTDFSTTAVTTQYGQMNSVNNDTWIGVTQNFSLPQVYRTQREHWKQQAGVSASEEVVRKNELKLQVKELYYGLLITAEKKQWLLQADSLYAEFVKRARQRLQAGETNVLELNTALNHQTQLRNQMLLLQQEYERLQQELQLLLNSTVPVVPVAGAVVYSFQLTTADAAAHPLLQWREQQLALAKQQVQLERTKLSPAFSIGYNNISLIGFQKIGTNEVYFGGSRRFSSALLGMNIPLFSKPVQTKIKAAGIQVQQQQVLRDAMQQQLLLRRKQAVNEYLKLQEVVANYNGLFTGSNEQMIKAANLQLQKGEINFLEWTLLINNLYQLRLQYLDAVRMLNSAAFVIESL